MFANVDWSNIAERALWTFVQGFLAAFTIVSITDVDALKGAAVAGATAGVAALLSFAKTVVQEVQAG